MNKDAENKRKALGRGLNSLFAGRTTAPAPELANVDVASSPDSPPVPASEPTLLRIEQIEPNPLQPRRIFQADRLRELSQSIVANGIIQPLVVRKAGDRYQLVAGERRWRAAKLANLTEVPVVVEDIPDERLLEITLIENIQREDLNAIETARAFERLIRELHLNHEEVGQRTGKDRSTISNSLRLLQLPADIQDLIAEKRLSAGHARCLLSLPTPELQREVAEKTVAQGLSVRQVERLTQRMIEPREPKKADEVAIDPNVKAAIDEMERALGTRVRIIEKGKNKGRVEIDYQSNDDLDRIYSAIVGTGSN